MLGFKDFFHLPQLDGLVEKLIAEPEGLIILAGLDSRPSMLKTENETWFERFLPSGRGALARLLIREIVQTSGMARCIYIGEKNDIHQSMRQYGRRIEFVFTDSADEVCEAVQKTVRKQPDMLVVERLTVENIAAVSEAASSGVKIFTQVDTILHGCNVMRQLVTMGYPTHNLNQVRWVISLQRLPALCQNCHQGVQPSELELSWLHMHFPGVLDEMMPNPANTIFYQTGACSRCDGSGRYGDVAVFDLFHPDPGLDAADLCSLPSDLPLEEYLFRLAAQGYLTLDDLMTHEARQSERIYHLLAASESAHSEADLALKRKLAELEASNRVLQARTETLFSLQEIGQALITSNDPYDLAVHICRHTLERCGANRSALYFLRPAGHMEILAVMGWDQALVRQEVDTPWTFLKGTSRGEVIPYYNLPPGVPVSLVKTQQGILRSGLCVPLVADQKTIGLLIVHTTRKTAFTPGDIALLQAFANQAALALQRADLVDQLRGKIIQLEAAQVELVKKERLERELELARQVQQSVLPRTFPQVNGYQFAARNEPARLVGGDFYDIFSLDEGYFGILVADVSDKGMPAALYMALTRSLILAEARRERSPKSVLGNVNRLLLEMGEPGMFVTVFYGIVNIKTHQLTYVRAGHDYPMLFRAEQVYDLKGQGAALGLLDDKDLHLSEESIELLSGDRLVLYTDGLTDILSPQEEPFSRDKLKDYIREQSPQGAQTLCQSIFTRLLEYQGSADQYDDMTLVILEVI